MYECWYCGKDFKRKDDELYCRKCVKAGTMRRRSTISEVDWKRLDKDGNGLSGVLRRSQEKLGARYRIVPPKNGNIGGVFDLKGKR